MLGQLCISFDRLSDIDFLSKARLIRNSLMNNPDFPEPWPEGVPSTTHIGEGIDRLQQLYEAALNRDRQKIAERKAERADLEAKFGNLARFLEIMAAGNIRKLQTTGFDMRRAKVTKTAAAGTTLPAPNLSVRHRKLPGTMICKANRLKGAGSYELQMTDGDPTVEENWRGVPAAPGMTAGIFVSCSKMEVSDLEPGRSYSFRLRGFSRNGAGLWSTVCTLRAL